MRQNNLYERRMVSPALNDLQKLRNFLRSSNPIAAREAASLIIRTASTLEIHLYLGKVVA